MNMKHPEKTRKKERSGSKYLQHDSIQRNAHDEENHVLPEISVLESDLDLPSAAAPVNHHDKKKKKKKEKKETAAPRVKAQRRASWHHSAPFETYVTNPDNGHSSQPKNNNTSEVNDQFKKFQRRRSSSCDADMGDWNINEIYKKSKRSIQRASESMDEVFGFGEAFHLAADTRKSSAVDAELLLAPTLVTRRAGLDGSSLHSSSNSRDFSLSRECHQEGPLLTSSEGLAATIQPRASRQGRCSRSPRLSKSRSRGASIPDIQGIHGSSFEMDMFGDEPIPPLPALRQTKSAFFPPPSRLHNQTSFPFLQQFKAAAAGQRREPRQGRRSMSPSLRQARSPGSSDPNIQGNDPLEWIY
jgi:hypothetical protein